MSNITLNMPDEILDEARVIAAKRKTTVNAMVRDYITSVVTAESRVARARKRLVELAAKSNAEMGDINWTRENLYDR